MAAGPAYRGACAYPVGSITVPAPNEATAPAAKQATAPPANRAGVPATNRAGVPAARGLTALALAFAALVSLTACTSSPPAERSGGRSTAPAATWSPPPRNAGLDYQLGGAYPPPEGVRAVVRDRAARPAPGLYNVCYVNAFQAQPQETADWPAGALLRDGAGRTVIDEDWDEALLDLRTDSLRRAAARRVGRWIENCARAGYQAVEPDNYDSFTRSHGLLSRSDATAYLTLIAGLAHRHGLAVAQKNTPELASARKRVGLDFAVAEECGAYEECAVYDRAFDGRVLVVEYTRKGLETACRTYAKRLSVVLRDRDVRPEGERGYVRATC